MLAVVAYLAFKYAFETWPLALNVSAGFRYPARVREQYAYLLPVFLEARGTSYSLGI